MSKMTIKDKEAVLTRYKELQGEKSRIDKEMDELQEDMEIIMDECEEFIDKNGKTKKFGKFGNVTITLTPMCKIAMYKKELAELMERHKDMYDTIEKEQLLNISNYYNKTIKEIK